MIFAKVSFVMERQPSPILPVYCVWVWSWVWKHSSYVNKLNYWKKCAVFEGRPYAITQDLCNSEQMWIKIEKPLLSLTVLSLSQSSLDSDWLMQFNFFFDLLNICHVCFYTTAFQAIFLYCCPECTSYLAHFNIIGWAIWAVIKKYSSNNMQMDLKEKTPSNMIQKHSCDDILWANFFITNLEVILPQSFLLTLNGSYDKNVFVLFPIKWVKWNISNASQANTHDAWMT